MARELDVRRWMLRLRWRRTQLPADDGCGVSVVERAVENAMPSLATCRREVFYTPAALRAALDALAEEVSRG